MNKSKKVLNKLYLTALIISLVIGGGFIVIGFPIVLHDNIVKEKAYQCIAKIHSEQESIKPRAELDWNSPEIAEREKLYNEKCNVSSSLFSKEEVRYDVNETWLTHSSSYASMFYKSLFGFGLALALFLMKKWLSWLLKD